jgi:hypothetical protein
MKVALSKHAQLMLKAMFPACYYVKCMPKRCYKGPDKVAWGLHPFTDCLKLKNLKQATDRIGNSPLN